MRETGREKVHIDVLYRVNEHIVATGQVWLSRLSLYLSLSLSLSLSLGKLPAVPPWGIVIEAKTSASDLLAAASDSKSLILRV